MKKTNGKNLISNNECCWDDSNDTALYFAIKDDKNAKRRWSIALACVLFVHAIPAVVAAYWLAPVKNIEPPEPAVFMDMAPAAAPPAPPASQEKPAQEQSKPKQNKDETKPKDQPKPLDEPIVKQKEVLKQTPTPPLPNPAVSLPTETVKPKPPEANKAVTQEDSQKSPKPSQSSQAAPKPAAPSLSLSRQSASHGRVTWQGLVLERLNRFQRYPNSSRSARQQGVPFVSVTINRKGKVISTQLQRSSGFAALDKEAINLPYRASPLPKPPADIVGETIEIVVPVEFFLK